MLALLRECEASTSRLASVFLRTSASSNFFQNGWPTQLIVSVIVVEAVFEEVELSVPVIVML